MRAIKTNLVAVLSVMLFFTACNNKNYTFWLNLNKGDAFCYNIEINDVVTSDDGNETLITCKYKSRYTVIADDVSEYEVDYRFDEIQITADGDTSINFDSNTTDTVSTFDNAGPMLKVMVDYPFHVKVSKNIEYNTIPGIEMIEDTLLNTFDDELKGRIAKWMIGEFAGESLYTSVQNIFLMSYFPDNPVKVGDSWVAKVFIDEFKYNTKIDVTVTLQNVDENVATFKIEQPKQNSNYDIKLHGAMRVNVNTGIVLSADIEQTINDKNTGLVKTTTIKTRSNQ